MALVHTTGWKRCMVNWLVLVILLGASMLPVQPTLAAGSPSLTYVRFEQSGTTIYAVYCIVADNGYSLNWGETYPSSWGMNRSYAAINGCTSKKIMFTGVNNNENLYVDVDTFSKAGGYATYGFSLYPRSTGLSCTQDWASTYLSRDPRLVDKWKCAFWDQ